MTTSPQNKPAAAMISFAQHVVAPRERELIERALVSGHVEGDGPFTAAASRSLERTLGAPRVFLTTSCTHALELSALALGVGPNDEVVMPSFTFVSTANAFALRGARIRFADINPHTWSMGVAELQAAMTPKTTVVVTMPYGGVTADPDELADVCKARSISLVEDAAHGLFASFRGRPLGTFGRLAALSFHRTKNVSCGEGGALIVNDTSLCESVEMLREKGTDRSRFLRGEVDKYTWRAVGSSYLPSDLLAAMLQAQLENAEVSQRQRHAIWQAYRAAIEPHAEELGMTLQRIPEGLEHPAHVFGILLPGRVDRQGVMADLAGQGARAVSHYVPLHSAPMHSGEERLPVTDDVTARLLRLPLHAAMQVSDAERIAESLLKSLRERLSA